MSPTRIKSHRAATTPDGREEIATLRIELIGSEPLIWRQVEVPTALTLKGLHDVIQSAMGWLDYHSGSSPSASGASAYLPGMAFGAPSRLATPPRRV